MTWRTDMENAPRDEPIELKLELMTRAFWDTEDERWVASRQVCIDYVYHPTAWRLVQPIADERVEPS